MESLTLSPRKLSREDIWSGVGGSVLVHALIFAIAIIGPLTSSKKIAVSSSWTVDLVSMQDLGLGDAPAPKAEMSQGAASAPGKEQPKGAPSQRGRPESLVAVKRLQLNDPSTKADAELKKLEVPELPRFATNPQGSAAVEKSLDKMIPKPKPVARAASPPIAQEAGGKGLSASSAPSQKPAQGAAEGSAGGGDKAAAGSRDGVAQGADKGSPPGGTGGAQVGVARRIYYAAIKDAITRKWACPEYLKAQRLETVLVVVVRRDGKVLDLRVEKSSGNEAYDESVRRAVRKAEPLPPFPAIYSPAQEEIEFRFRPEDLS